MKGMVYFVELSDAQIADVNREGWESPVGLAYLKARYGDESTGGEPDRTEAKGFGMVRWVAYVDVKSGDPETVWKAFQNGIYDDLQRQIVVSKVPDKMRSMDIGDFIVWDNGTVERVESVGFATEVQGTNVIGH